MSTLSVFSLLRAQYPSVIKVLSFAIPSPPSINLDNIILGKLSNPKVISSLLKLDLTKCQVKLKLLIDICHVKLKLLIDIKSCKA